MTTFHPDGPHSPAQTIAAAEQVAHLLKFLNMATRSGQDGLSKPADLYAVLGALSTAMERYRQLCGHLEAFLVAQEVTEKLSDSGGKDAGRQVTDACLFLANAGNRSREAADALQQAQNAATGLYLTGDDDG